MSASVHGLVRLYGTSAITATLILLIGACFDPVYPEERRCSNEGRCPDTQVCVDGTCLYPRNAQGVDPVPCAAGSQRFTYTGSIESFSVPACVTEIQVEAVGAAGGGDSEGNMGGKGALMNCTLTLGENHELRIAVGGEGQNSEALLAQGGGTGGGGSFVASDSGSALVVAGGGGGATDSANLLPGGEGQSGERGQDGGGTDNPGLGGSNGEGGSSHLNTPGGFHSGTAGGGFLSDGSGDSNGDASRFGTPNMPGSGFLSGASAKGQGGSAGRNGGFGGGGSAGFTGGGGGGYSGGGSGGVTDADRGGGGGSSYCIGQVQESTPGVGSGAGEVTISWAGSQ